MEQTRSSERRPLAVGWQAVLDQMEETLAAAVARLQAGEARIPEVGVPAEEPAAESTAGPGPDPGRGGRGWGEAEELAARMADAQEAAEAWLTAAAALRRKLEAAAGGSIS